MSTTTNLGLYKHDNVDSNENEFDIEKALNENWDKVDEKVGEQDTAITNLNTMQSNIEAEIGTKVSKIASNITASTDFNSLIETGIYQYGGTNSANKPPNWGIVEVTNTNGYIVQKCYGSGSIATRFSTDNGSTWGDWRNLLEEKVSCNQKYKGIDLNTINNTEIGDFDMNCTSTPYSGAGGYLETIKMSENYAMQIATQPLDGTEYKRLKIGGTWGNWELANGTNITTGTEFKTGRMIDGKEEYGKFINLGNLGNATYTTASHGLTNVLFTKVVAHITDGSISFDTPYGFPLGESNGVSISCNVQGSYVQVTTNSDRTAYTAVVELNYLKI